MDVIDQRALPFSFEIMRLTTVEQAAFAISEMVVRGAPLIGATAAYGVCLALLKDPMHGSLDRALELLGATRPTAVNLRWALEVMDEAVRYLPVEERVAAAYQRAARICDEDVEISMSIGRHGLAIFRELAAAKGAGSAQYSDPLQRRLARHRRLGHRPGAHLHGIRRRSRCPRLGR